MLVKERLEEGQWVPPWLRHQHIARYEWARSFCQGGRVLDAACGSGYGSNVLRAAAGVVSLDIAPEAIGAGRRSLGNQLRLLLGDTTRLPFRSGSFDTFVSFETIEHVLDDAAYVREARRVVKRGGVFICSTPNRAVVNPGNSIDDPPFNTFHVREYTLDELILLLRGAFGQVTTLGQRGFSGQWVNLLSWVGSRSRISAVRLHQLRKTATMPLERRAWHEPRRMGEREQPEVLIAVCR